MSPDGMKLWIYFITAWVLFWATAGGVVCKSLGRPAWKGIVLGGILMASAAKRFRPRPGRLDRCAALAMTEISAASA